MVTIILAKRGNVPVRFLLFEGDLGVELLKWEDLELPLLDSFDGHDIRTTRTSLGDTIRKERGVAP
jgi:hypothetical protein